MLKKLNEKFLILDAAEEPPQGHRQATWGGHSFRRTGAREWHRCGVPFELLQRMGRWSSDAIASYIAGMILDVQAQLHCPASSNAGISILRMDAQLAQRLSSIEAKLDQVISFGGRSHFVVGRSAGETTQPPK